MVAKGLRTRTIDWTDVASKLRDDLSVATQGNIWLDGRLWALLHRVIFLDTHENPLTGIRQVKVGCGLRYTEQKWFDLPSLTQNIVLLWKTARQFDRTTILGCGDGLRLNDEVRVGWDLGLLLAQEVCSQIIRGKSAVLYTLPEDQHVRIRKVPKAIFLETWDARIKVENLNKIGGAGSKPPLKGNKHAGKKDKSQ